MAIRRRRLLTVGAGALGAVLTVVGCASPEQPMDISVGQVTPSLPPRPITPQTATPGSSTSAPAPAAVRPRLEPGCPAPIAGQHLDASGLNATMNALTLPQWRAADVGASAALSDGRVAWVFGDTVRPAGASPRIVGSSMLVSSGDCFSQVLGDVSKPLIPLPQKGESCWPTSIAAVPVPGGDDLYVVCSRVRHQPGGLLDFTYLGATLARLQVGAGGIPVLLSVTQLTADHQDATQVNWGAGMLREGDWLYLYGSRQPDGAAAKEAYVARAPLARLTQRAAWQYYDGRSWQGAASRAAAVLPVKPGVSQAFSVSRIGSKVVLVSKKGGEFGATVGVWTASTPQGPWRLASETPLSYDDGSGIVRYQPLAHPEIALTSGRLLVSVSRTPKDFTDLFRSPQRSRPLFLEVPQP